MEEDDPVVKTLPVFLSNEYIDKLCLLQYLSRPPCVNNPHPLLPPSLRGVSEIQARVKPKVGQVELSVPLEVDEGTRENRFNKDKASEQGKGLGKEELEAIGKTQTQQPSRNKRRQQMLNMMDTNGDESFGNGPTYDGPLVSHMTLRGDLVPDQTNYCVAYLKNGQEVHLTPLTMTMHMQPHQGYLDNLRAIARLKQQPNDGDSDDDDDQQQQNQQQQPPKKTKKSQDAVQVSMKMSENLAGNRDRSNGRATGALFAPLRASESEPWVRVRHFDSTAPESSQTLKGLECKRPLRTLEAQPTDLI